MTDGGELLLAELEAAKLARGRMLAPACQHHLTQHWTQPVSPSIWTYAVGTSQYARRPAMRSRCGRVRRFGGGR
jgi:hypothetical protein